jgi:hypothetical protein
MKTRVRKLEGSSKWVAEVGKGCCDWQYIDPITLEVRMPVMPYEDWYLHDSEEKARFTLSLFLKEP